MTRVAVIPGDGIGREVIAVARRALEIAGRMAGVAYEFEEFPWGADHYLATGETLPEDAAERLRIFVRDAGPGIPNGELERVFEPFHRLEGSRNRSTGGTGLGLTIARNIAQAHGGELVLRNRPAGGLEAVLTLPRNVS